MLSAVQFGCRCAACDSLRYANSHYTVVYSTAAHHDECNCNECKIAKRPPPQCPIDCYDCKPTCKVLADRERTQQSSAAGPALQIACGVRMTVTDGNGRPIEDSDKGIVPEAYKPRHPIYKWTGPIPWAPEEW